MNTTQSEPKSNVFCLTGILASLLLITSLLTEGNAHIVSIPPTPSTLTQADEDITPETIQLPATTKKPQELQNTTKHDGSRERLVEESENNGRPKKKRMGLALIFLGILAEEG